MAKKLTTSVHFVDPDSGETRVIGPDSKLSRADVRTLEENWGDRAGEFLVDDGEESDAPEERPRQATSPAADRVPADPAPRQDSKK